MNNRLNQIAALFIIYLLVVSPLTLAQEETSPPEQSDPFSTADEQFQNQNDFNSNPTPENFNQLPNPTAADLERVPNPTLGNFNRLSSTEQGKYLSNENKYKQEFADQYYLEPANWGANNLADKVFFKQQTGLRDFLKKGAVERDAAQKYFSHTFKAPYQFDQIADDFFFNQEKGMLKNGLTNLVLAEFRNDQSIIGITSTNDGFKISRKIDEKEQEVSVAGTEAKTISYDQQKGIFSFQLADGGKQTFEIPNDARVTFTFDAGTLTVDGPASGIINIQKDYAQFKNHEGKLIVNYNGDIDAENAEVITSRLFMDGRYSKRGNKIEAWDVGAGGKQTVVVDKNACPEIGACVGVSTQGQWDARYLSDKSKASTLKINLDEISSTSSFYADPNKPQPTGEDKVEKLREQAQQLRKPAQPPLQGKNAEVWINKDEQTQAITVTSKGVVAVGLYDARGNSAKQLKDKLSYKGLTGLSELDMQFSARTTTNVRGQAEFKNDQFREGVFTNQDGAVIKVNHDNFRPDQADALRAECFDCTEGEAIVIHKSVAIAKETGTSGVFAGADRAGVRLAIEVDEKGKIKPFEPSRQDLGFLAKEIPQDGQEVSIGRNLVVSVPCGDLACNFRLSRDPRTAELGAAYEFVDPKDPEKVVRRIEYPLTVGEVLGSEAILVSEQNAAEVNRLTSLVEQRKFNELSSLSFEKDDPAYAALKKKFILESGVNLDAISDPKYARDLQTIVDTTKRARDVYQKYGIELDAFGNFKSREDAEKYQKIVNKGLGADVDELTRAKWDLARMRVKEVEGLLAACQGTSYCPVSEEQLKAAKEEEKRILGIRTGNYNRWKALVRKAELERQLKEAEERAKREDKGIDATDKREIEDTKRKIDNGKKREVDLKHTLEAQRGRRNQLRNEIWSKLEKEWLVGGGKKSIFLAIDEDRFNSDPDYVIHLINRHAPRGFFDNKLDPEVYTLREDFRADAAATVETQRELEQLDKDLKGLDSQNQALIEKYRMEGKDDVAAEVALLAGKYKEVENILSGPSIAAEGGIKEVVKLGKDEKGNVVVLETIDVSVLAGQKVVSDDHAKNIVDRAVRQQRDETLDQVALLYDYGYGNEAGAILQEIEADNPELAQKLQGSENVPEALLDPDLAKLKKARIAQTSHAKRVLEEREKELEQAKLKKRFLQEEEELGAGRAVANAWKNIGTSGNFLDAVADSVALAGHSFSFIADSGSKAGAEAFGIEDVRNELDKRALDEQERQIDQLHSLRLKLRDYEKRGLSAGQAFADARAGIDRAADGSVVSSTSDFQIGVADEPAAALLEFDLTRSVFSEEDKKFLEASDDILAKTALTQQRKEQYEAERRELEFNVIVRDAENARSLNRDKLAGEAAAKYKEALAVCPDCAGAKSVQRTVDSLNQNVLGEVIAVYTGETVGRTIAGGLERVGVTYSSETEQIFRDTAISEFYNVLLPVDLATEFLSGGASGAVKLGKIAKLAKALEKGDTVLDAYRYASKGTREAYVAARAAERAADTAEAAVEARKAFDAAKEALQAEIIAGWEASKYQKFKRVINTPLGKFDRDIAKARNVEIDNIATQTQNLNQAQRELAAARASGDTVAEGQSLVKISDAQEALVQSTENIDELDDLLRVSNIAGPNKDVVRRAWDSTFGKVLGDGPGEEVLRAEDEFRRVADEFADASKNAQLVGDTPEAILSRTKLDAAKENLEVAAQKVDDAYLNRKFERSKSALGERLQQAEVSREGDEVYDAVGAEGVAKLDELASNPAVRVEPEGTGLRFEVPEDAPPQLRIEVEEGNEILRRIDTTEARAEAELEEMLLEDLANSEYVAANDVKARRLEAVGVAGPQIIPDELDSLRTQLEPLGARWELAPDGRLRYNLDDVPIETIDIDGVRFEGVRIDGKLVTKEEFLGEVRKAEDLINSPGRKTDEVLNGAKTEAVNPCSLAAAAIYGLAPCARTVAETPSAKVEEAPEKIDLEEIVEQTTKDLKTRKEGVQVITKPGVPDIATAEVPISAPQKQVNLPPRVQGQDDWNEIVDVLDTHPGSRIPESDLEKLVNKEKLLLGSGGEGVVLEIPEAVRVNLPNVEKPAIIKVRNIDRSLEGAANTFPEQADFLNRLADRGAAPRVYQAEDTYYIAEKIEGQTLAQTIRERLTPQQLEEYRLANDVEGEAILLRAEAQGQFDDVVEAVDTLADDLVAENIEIGDFHWGNIILTKTPEGKLEAKVLDAGFAIPGEPSLLRQVYDEKVREALTGGGFDIDFTTFQKAKRERTGRGVSDVVDSCAVAGGAIYGLAPCPGAPAARPGAAPEKITAPPVETNQRAIADLEEGQSFRVRSKSGNSYGGKYLKADEQLITIQTGEKERFFGLLGSKPETNTLRIDRLDQSSIIKEGDQIRIAGTSGRPYAGKYAGEDSEFFRLTYANGDTVRFRKTDLNFDTLQREGEVVTAAPKPQNVKDIFENKNLANLQGKSDEEIFKHFYDSYNHKTSPNIIEEGKVNQLHASIGLQNKIDPDKVDISPGGIQGGWIAIQSVEDLPHNNRIRFYINSKNFDSSQVILEKVGRELTEQQIPFKIKTSRNKAAFARRTDNTVLYVEAAHQDQVEKILAGINPTLLDEEIPLFTKPVGRGVSWAEDPGNVFYKGLTENEIKYIQAKDVNAPSFGQARAEALTEIYTVTGGKTGPEFDKIKRQIFEKYGINPDQPWLNLDSRLGDVPIPRESGPRVRSDVIEPCAVAGGAIYGLASCSAARAAEPLPAEELGDSTLDEIVGKTEDISGVRIKEPRFFESEPLLLERKVETPSQISREIATVKGGYAQQKINLEKIVQRHPTVQVQDAEVAFTNKLGEGTVGLVYEADLPGVGDDLAFKTAKALPGERILRGNLESNVDGLFIEFEKAREACKLVPCPQYYGIYKVDGVPYLVSDKIKGRHFFDLTDEEVVQYFTPEKIELFTQDLARAIDAGWNPHDLQAMVLTEPHHLGGKQYQAGDVLFVDVADWSFKEGRTPAQKQELLQAWVDNVMTAPRSGAENALAFKRDLTPAAEAVQSATQKELLIALDATGYDISPEVLVYIRPGEHQLRRMYEQGIDPLLVSTKIPEAKAVRFKQELPRSADVVENADIAELQRAMHAAGYQATPDVLNIIRNEDSRLQLMYKLGIDPEKVAKEMPGTHAERFFETSTGKYIFDTKTGKWVQPREGLVDTLFGDKEADEVTVAILNKAREKAGVPKAQAAVIQKGDNAFEIAGKDYYFEEGKWKQKRTLWFDKEVDDAEIIAQLDQSRARLIEEGQIVLPEVKLESCSVGRAAVGGAIAGLSIAGPCLPLNLPSEEIVFELPPADLPEPKVVTTVQGYEGTVSNLYDSVGPQNVDEVFQNKLEFLGEDIYGGKAIAYIHDDGRVQVVFLTESDKTHHRQALGTIIGGEKGDLVYDGQYDNYLIADLPNRAFGFEFQYDKSKGKIIGMQASSQITNIQKAKGTTGWKISDQVVEYVEQEMLEKIDLDLIDESLVDQPINQWIDKGRLPTSSSSS